MKQTVKVQGKYKNRTKADKKIPNEKYKRNTKEIHIAKLSHSFFGIILHKVVSQKAKPSDFRKVMPKLQVHYIVPLINISSMLIKEGFCGGR